MKLVSVADRIVFSSIKNFEYGQINLKNYDGKEYKLGNENSSLKANLIINKPGVTLNILNKGSCIFLHLTKTYKPTAGCIALKKKDFLIMLKLIDKKTKIKIFLIFYKYIK